MEAVKAFEHGGVGILAGTDAGNPFAFRDYRKSLEVNPKNMNAVKELKQLGAE